MKSQQVTTMQNHIESSNCLQSNPQDDQEKEIGECISDMELSDLSETDTAKIIVQKSPQAISLVSEGETFSNDPMSMSDESEKVCLENVSSDSNDFSTFNTTGINSHAKEKQRQCHSSDQRQHQKHKTHRKSSPDSFSSNRYDKLEFARLEKYYDDPRQRKSRHRKRRSRSRSKEKCHRCDEFELKAVDFVRRSKRSRDRYDDFEYRNNHTRKRRKRERRSKSPYLRRSKSPYVRKSRSPYLRGPKSSCFRKSRSPYLRRSKSPHLGRSRSPYLKRSKSPYLRSRSPCLRKSKSPHFRRSKSPYLRRSKSPHFRRSKSPYLLKSRSPYLRRSKSPHLRRSKSPYLRRSKSPYVRKSRSPYLRGPKSSCFRKSRSPYLRRSKSPHLSRSRSPYIRRSKSPQLKMSRGRNESRRPRGMNNDQMYSSISDDSNKSPNQEKRKKGRPLTFQERVRRLFVNHNSPVESSTSDVRSVVDPNNEARNPKTMPKNFHTNAIQASVNASDNARSINDSEMSISQSVTEPYLKEGEKPIAPAATPTQSSFSLPHDHSQAGTSLATEPAGLPVQVNLNLDSIPYHKNVDSNDNPFPENPTEELFPNEISIRNPPVPANIILSVPYPTPKGDSTFSGSTGKPMIPCFSSTKLSQSILVPEPPSYSLPEDQEPHSSKEVDDGKQIKARDDMVDAILIDVSNDSVSIEDVAKKKSPITIDIDSDSDADVSCPSIECLESSEKNNDVTSTNPIINYFSEPETSDDEGALQIVCETPIPSPQPDEPKTEDKSPYKYEIDESLIKRVQKEIERMSKERFRPYPLGSLILFEPLREPPKKDDPFESPLTRNRIELPFVKYGASDVSPNPKDPIPIAFRFQSTGAYQKEREKRKKKKKDKNAGLSNSRSKKIATASVGIQCDLTSQVILKLNLKISQLKDVINRLELMNITAAVKREPKPEKE